MNHLTFVQHPLPLPLPVSLRGMQKWLGQSIEESGVFAPEWCVKCRTRFPQIKAISNRLGVRSKFSHKLPQSTYTVNASTWTRWSGLAQVMSKLKYRTVNGKSYLPDHLLRWTLNIRVSSSRRPRGQRVLHQEVLDSSFVKYSEPTSNICRHYSAFHSLLAVEPCNWCYLASFSFHLDIDCCISSTKTRWDLIITWIEACSCRYRKLGV